MQYDFSEYFIKSLQKTKYAGNTLFGDKFQDITHYFLCLWCSEMVN